MLEPVRGVDLHRRRVLLAQQNGKVVQALNQAKATILNRFGRSGRPGARSGRYFRLYFMAQDIHERASSSHYPYSALTEAFFHSDILFRCQRLLKLQATACSTWARRSGSAAFRIWPAESAGTDRSAGLAGVSQAAAESALAGPAALLDLLGHNLSTLERQFSEAGNSDSGRRIWIPACWIRRHAPCARCSSVSACS